MDNDRELVEGCFFIILAYHSHPSFRVLSFGFVRSGARRPFIVNLSPFRGRPDGLKVYRRVRLTLPRFGGGGSPGWVGEPPQSGFLEVLKMDQEIEETEWFTPDELSDKDLSDVLDNAEIGRLQELAESPELECFEIVHAQQGGRRWSE